MEDLKQLLYYQFERNGKPINWIGFFRSNMTVIQQASLKEREDFIREFIDEIDCFSIAAQTCRISIDFVRQTLYKWDDNDLFYALDSKIYNSLHEL